MNDGLLCNLDKIHTTELGLERIKKNLCLDTGDIVEWCKEKTKRADDIFRKGKNWYIHVDDCVITINAYSFTIITAHKKKLHSPHSQYKKQGSVDVHFERATPKDIDALIDVQNKSFLEDFLKYGVCPGYNRAREDMADTINSRIVYKIICGETVAGDIIVRDNGGGNYFLGCICVIPRFENMGIGQKAMRFIEDSLPDAVHWSLETPSDKLRNHYFYKKHGYRITKEYIVDNVKISFFEKQC